ncbi:MAG: histidine phosphatase family protein [Acidimicrobiales bacterium]
MPSTSPPPSLVLVRHGETTWNHDRLVQGHSDDAILTERGISQAHEAAAALRARVFDSIVASDLRRARDTAMIIAGGRGLEVVTTLALRERAYGVYEGGSFLDLPVSVAGFDGEAVVDADARPLGGESLNDLYERAGRWLAQLRLDYAGARVLVVTHGGTLRAIRAACAATPIATTAWYPVDNASVWTTDVNGRPLA